MVGPYGHWLQFPFPGTATLVVPEVDGVRVLTPKTCELLQRVPAETDAIRKLFSTEPAAMLFDAMERFEDGDVKADDNIRSLLDEGTMGQAVRDNVLAAAGEFDPAAQKQFLRAASYGLGAAVGEERGPRLDPAVFVETARKLRVLNQVSHQHTKYKYGTGPSYCTAIAAAVATAAAAVAATVAAAATAAAAAAAPAATAATAAAAVSTLLDEALTRLGDLMSPSPIFELLPSARFEALGSRSPRHSTTA